MGRTTNGSHLIMHHRFAPFVCFILLAACRTPREESAPPRLLPVGLTFDYSALEPGLEILQGSSAALGRLVTTPGAQYILRRQRKMTGHRPDPHRFFSSLFQRLRGRPGIVDGVRHNRIIATAAVSGSRRLVSEVLQYLPAEFRFTGSLYFTVGYDIGTALSPDASLNLAHPKFLANPREIPYYIMHELHHVGYMRYHPMPDLHNLGTARRLLGLIRYATHLEGMGVYTPWAERRRNGDLKDPDYRVLGDPALRKKKVEAFFRNLRRLEEMGDRALPGAEVGKILEEMSGTGRLWYIAGAHMAEAIAKDLGLPALRRLVIRGPDAFFKVYFATLGQETISLNASQPQRGKEDYGVLVDDGGRIVLPGPIVFADPLGKILTEPSRQVLRALVPFLRESLKTAGIEIDVHYTGPRGVSAALAPQLRYAACRRRGQTVRNFLMGLGLPGAALQVKEYGDTMPMVPHGVPGAHRRNDRVELRLVSRRP